MKANRLLWVDYAKFIGIFLVVFGHTAIPDFLYNAIFAFHMPLFFFISGYLFSFEKYYSYKQFVARRAAQLVVPYFCFNLITYIFWMLIGRKFGDDATRNIPVYKPLIGIIYGNGTNDYLVHNIASWFLVCLFVVENLFYIIFKYVPKNKSWCFIALFFIAGCFDSAFDSIRWPWSFNIALVAIVFYAVANVYKEYVNKLLRWRTDYLLILIFLLSAFYLYVVKTNGRINLNESRYQNFGYFFIGAFLGILIVILVSRILQHMFSRVRFIEFISINTIIILVFQFIALSVVKAFTLFVLKIPLAIFNNKIILNLIVTVLVIVMLVPVIYLLNAYFPFVLGKKKAHPFAFKEMRTQ